jgi:hypothetical protein
MKKRIELDVDFIGGGKKPSKEEFLAISEFIKAQKAKRILKQTSTITPNKKKEKQPA